MIWKPRVLIAEDDRQTSQNMRELFSGRRNPARGEELFTSFDVDAAATGTEARGFLECAKKNAMPYDVLVLDVGLPNTSDRNDIASPEVGKNIFLWADEKHCSAILVESVHTEVSTFVPFLRFRHAEFVPKRWAAEKILQAIGRAYKDGIGRSWERVRRDRFERVLKQWAYIQARAQVADRLGQVVSEGIGRVLDSSEALSELIEERFPLDAERGADDPVTKALARVKDAAIETARECSVTRSAFAPLAGALQPVRLGDVVRQSMQQFRAGVLHKNLTIAGLSSELVQVHTYPTELQMIIEEILFGALDESGEHQTVKVDIARDDQKQAIVLSVTDQAPIIPEDLRDKLRAGSPVEPQHGRWWGLSLALRASQSIGACMDVIGSKLGNTITVMIPLTADD